MLSLFLNIFLVPTALLRWNQTGFTIADISGVPGNGSDKLNTPYDATLDYLNTLYIADANNNRIQKYLIGTSNGTTVCGNGTSGSSSNQLSSPSYVLVDSNGNIRVADTFNQRIQLFSNGSSSGITIASSGKYPYGIAYDSTSDKLYIADYNKDRIMCYASGASTGVVVAGGNGRGTNITQLAGPVRVYFDSFSNSLIIANHLAHNIVRWPLGATSWILLAGDINGNSGSNATTLTYPIDVTLDPMGNMYVADRLNYRIQLFLNGQTEGITIAGVAGISGNNSILLNMPFSVELDSQLNLYVIDSSNHRVQKFLRY
ncbi:unnamed protein product [Rotaria sp. Silwood1]|nr:unnamed protein product [Rotaria sp. Silwood1]CAF4748572.1 unnamed protein product [Rotaria sp. Silwood1]